MAPKDIDRLHEEIEELFADLWHVPRFLGSRRGFRPNVDSFHTDEPHELTVVVELPGVDPETVNVVVSETMLVIAGERTRSFVEGRIYQQMEIEYGPFQRQVQLPENVDPNAAQASYENGVLTISLPVSEVKAPAGRVAIAVERP